jgi:two-component system LytT family response regulator
MIKAVIVDDEQLAIESLQWEIENFSQDIKVIETFTNPKDAVSGINYLKPDLVFLDIEMPEIDGFQLLQLLDYKNFDLIITTAYNQYAIQAFKANAIDYLLKPVDPDDLVQAIEKVKLRQQNNNSTKNIETVLNKLVRTGLERLKKIPLSLSNRIILVEPDKILYCKSDGSYTTVYMKDGEEHLVSKSIKHIEELLPEEYFIRVHKSYIVNLNEVKELIKQGTGEIVLSNDRIIPISRSHRKPVFEALNIT